MGRRDQHNAAYTSIFAEWDSKSAVRSRPRRMVHEIEDGRSAFSAALAPSAAHPLVLARGHAAVQELLARRLYLYLDFTTVLEQEFVNPVLMEIARAATGVRFSAEMRFDSYKIYCDEAYHALLSVDLRRQVEAATGVWAGEGGYEPHFARVLRRVRQSLARGLRPAVDLCFAVVSETLISGVLSALPADVSVVSAVRESVADHAMDERRHHAYFTRVLDHFWPQLGRADQDLLAPLFGEFILAFLDPDLPSQARLLRDMRFTAQEAALILHESEPVHDLAANARHAARSTLRLLERVGVLDGDRLVDHYWQLGLLPLDGGQAPHRGSEPCPPAGHRRAA